MDDVRWSRKLMKLYETRRCAVWTETKFARLHEKRCMKLSGHHSHYHHHYHHHSHIHDSHIIVTSWLPVEKFPKGSAQCFDDKSIFQNIRAAAKSQWVLDDMNTALADPDQCSRIMEQYRIRCPPPANGGKMAKDPFACLTYLEEVRQFKTI